MEDLVLIKWVFTTLLLLLVASVVGLATRDYDGIFKVVKGTVYLLLVVEFTLFICLIWMQ